ncbi:MAG: PilN domain-containing protein, partial [Candidatus Omnitrophica bacterium]|nr:PilN domain-containing protein [Candidatus Omnitrophota bacterium]
AAFISGAGIKSDMISTLEAELGIPVKMLPSPCPPEALKDAVDIALNVSLTAVAEFACRGDHDRRINFNLPEIQIRKSLREKTRDIIILGSYCIYIFTLICVAFFGKIQNQQNYLAKINKQYAGIEAEFKDKIDRLNKIELVKKRLISREVPMFVISQLQRILPNEVVLASISIDEDNTVSLRGQAVQLADVFKFSAILEKVDHFKNIQEKSTRKKKVKDKDLTEFEIVFNVEL